MYERILVPLDGSEVAASVLPFVTSLAQRMKSRVTLLTVVAPTRPTARVAETEIQAEAQALVRRQAQQLNAAGVEADTLVVPGQAAEQIVARAREGGFDLIAIGTRGHSGIRRGLLGSVTDEVVRSSQAPVLVLSPRAVERSAQDNHRLSSITVPLDGSELAENILTYAEGLAKQLSLEVHLLRVVSMAGALAYYAGEAVPVDTSPIEEELEQEAQAYLNKVAEDLTKRGLKVSSAVVKGSPALAITDLLRNTHSTLAAICTHGRSGLGRLLIGSVADSIIRSAGVPVLVVTPQVAPGG